MSEHVTIIEVGPRDGLQNEKKIIPPEIKIELVDRLSKIGLKNIEAGAFVSPKWVPQMAASDEVLNGITREKNISYPVLTPNLKGYEGAKAAGADTVAIFGAASESFSQKNINASIAESLERFSPVIEAARKDNIRVRGYVSCVLGCPYEGDVPIANVVRVATALHAMGCYEISLGDTIGVGTAGKTKEMIRAVASEMSVSVLAGHFHDTYGQSLANIHAALNEGVRVFDSSVSGLGGCPYAPGTSGNVASEDVLYMLEGSGFETGIDLEAMIEISLWISEKLGRAPASKVTLAKTAICSV